MDLGMDFMESMLICYAIPRLYELDPTEARTQARLWACGHGDVSTPTFGSHQFLTGQLTLSQPGGGGDYAHHSTKSPSGFSDLAMALKMVNGRCQTQGFIEIMKLLLNSLKRLDFIKPCAFERLLQMDMPYLL